MSNIVKISLLGLALPDESLIRSYFRLYCSKKDIEPQWLPAGTASESLMIINYNLREMQKVKDIIANSIAQVLWVRRDGKNDFERTNSSRDFILNVPVYGMGQLNDYLDECLGYKAPPAILNEWNPDLVSELRQKFKETTQNSMIYSPEREIGWYEPSTQNLWLLTNHIKNTRQVDLKALTIPESIRLMTPLKLEPWIWDFAWQLSENAPKMGNVTTNLLRWPQPAPMEAGERGKILKMCAYLQSSPMSVEAIARKGGFDPEWVERVVQTLLLCGYGQLVSDQGTKGKTEERDTAVGRLPDAEKAKVGGFLSRLRNRLGL